MPYRFQNYNLLLKIESDSEEGALKLNYLSVRINLWSPPALSLLVDTRGSEFWVSVLPLLVMELGSWVCVKVRLENGNLFHLQPFYVIIRFIDNLYVLLSFAQVDLSLTEVWQPHTKIHKSWLTSFHMQRWDLYQGYWQRINIWLEGNDFFPPKRSNWF